MSKKPAGLSAGLITPGAGLVSKTAAAPINPAAVLTPSAVAPAPSSFRAETAQPGVAATAGVDIPIRKIHDNKFNARRFYRPEVVKERAASLATDGQRTAAAVVPHPDLPGEFMLIDGGYRKRGLLHLGKETMRCDIYTYSTYREMYRLSRLYNHQHDTGSILDDAFAWADLLEQKIVADQDELAELVGASKGEVSKTLALSRLPDEIRQMLVDRSEAVTIRLGYEISLLAKVMPVDQLEPIVAKALDGSLSARDLESLRARMSGDKQRKPKELSRQYVIKNSEGQYGVLKEWDNGKVVLEVNLTDASQREILVEEFKRRFAIGPADSSAT